MPLLTSPTIEETATRIERAYLRRHPEWRQLSVPARVWAKAAAALLELNRAEPSLPIDPELFVAAQPGSSRFPDPWEQLIRDGAIRRYRRRIDAIVRGLRDELRAEVRYAERRIEAGESPETVLLGDNPALSALGRYIVAHRARRADLAELFAGSARDQHEACPLYRPASAALIRSADYPAFDLLPGLRPRRSDDRRPRPFSLN